MHSPIAATALLEPIPRLPIPPKSAARFVARAFCARLRLPTRTVRKPLAVVALATIEPSRTGETLRDWPQAIAGECALYPVRRRRTRGRWQRAWPKDTAERSACRNGGGCRYLVRL